MTYIQGFLLPVPQNKREAYREMAESAVPFFEKHGAGRIVEAFADDVPHGQVTDMYRAVAAKDDEAVVFSWIDWKSKEACEQASKAMESDPEMQMPAEMPFDPQRMIYAGFEALGEAGAPDGAGYVQGYVAPVPKDKKADFAEMCATMREVMLDHGAVHALDGWADEIADGKVTDFKRAVAAEDGEAVAFGYVEWPSKQAFEQAQPKIREDERMPAPGAPMPLDGKRLIFGGFEMIMDSGKE